MANDRPARLLDLVHLLGGRRGRTLQEIASHFEKSPRTIYRDLAALQEQHIPIVLDQSRYKLLESAKLRPLNLNAEERAILRLALENPVLEKRPELRRPLQTLKAKLEAVTAALVESPEALALAGIDRSGSTSEETTKLLERAIAEQRTLAMRYTSLSGNARRNSRKRRVDPYRLFHRSEAWYLAGHCHRNRELRIFRLDRIVKAEITPDHFELPDDFDLDKLFESSWGIYRGKKRHDIRLHFDESLAPLLQSARHHASEQIQRTVGGGIEYRVVLDNLDEIARWIVGFGGRCKAVEPEALRRKVEEIARGVLGDDSI